MREITNEKQLIDAITLWQKWNIILSDADDHTICPECHDQILSCDCLRRLSYDIVSYEHGGD